MNWCSYIPGAGDAHPHLRKTLIFELVREIPINCLNDAHAYRRSPQFRDQCLCLDKFARLYLQKSLYLPVDERQVCRLFESGNKSIISLSLRGKQSLYLQSRFQSRAMRLLTLLRNSLPSFLAQFHVSLLDYKKGVFESVIASSGVIAPSHMNIVMFKASFDCKSL